ncbi:MAG: hypothetical protein AB7T06_05635 [Kofleriaceae bacterium]
MEVNIGYAWGQLQRAIASGHADKIARWRAVIDGMRDGTIAVGSRTPTSAPAWVTLDVATGGFATGGNAAGGAIAPWEAQLATERGLGTERGLPNARLALNLYFLDAAETLERFERGTYRIDLPEEAALLVVAWLRSRGEIEKATAIVDAIAPWFETLRFYPRFADSPLEERDTVQLQSIGKTREAIAKQRRQRRFEMQREAIRVWRPLFDRAIDLAREALAGTVRTEAIARLRDEVVRAGTRATRRAKEAEQLVERLVRFETLDVIERRRLEHLVRQRTGHTRADDTLAIAAPLHADLRRVLVERLAPLPDEGSAPLDAMAPVRIDEATRFGVPAGSALPAYLERKVARSWDAPLATLVERGVLPSGESLAIVLPQVTGHVRAGSISDGAARRLYAALYRAFRRRRGLLLLWYQNQVRLHELPWAAALEAVRGIEPSAVARARDVVASTSWLAIRSFPQTITPNKLVTELHALAAAADLNLPLVEELAADIFMGSFTAKFVLAAHATARVIPGTLYQRYYAIDVDELAELPVPSSDPKAPIDKRISHELAVLCKRRAGPPGTSRSQAAANGTIIEQAQILTTHNLSVLFDGVPLLRKSLTPLHVNHAAGACFTFVLRRLTTRTPGFHQILINLKKAAYAWRQMVFFLSFARYVGDFMANARRMLEKREDEFRMRFEPAMRGLELAIDGIASNEPAFSMSGGRVFLGWTTEHPWLAPPKLTP